MFGLSLFKGSAGKNIKQTGEGPPDSTAPHSMIPAVCKKKVAVNISVLGTLDSYESQFLGWDEKTYAFYVAPIQTSTADFALTQGQTSVRFNFTFHNIRRRFRALYAGIWQFNGLDTLRFSVPEQIETVQRREYYRVSPKVNQPVKVQFRYEQMETSEAIDISAGGVSFSFSKRIIPGVKLGLSLDIPNERLIKTDVETCGYGVFNGDMEKGSALPSYKVRTKFSHLNLGDSELIGHYVAKRQRDLVH